MSQKNRVRFYHVKEILRYAQLPTYNVIIYNYLHSIGPLGEYLLGFHAIKAVKQLNPIMHQLTLLTPDLWAII